MNTLLSIQGFLFILLGFIFLITVHELGHWILARYYKFKTPIFSVGFGKPYLTLGKKFDTEFRLSAIPFGGYVAIPAMDDVSSQSESEPRKPVGQRAMVALAGPLFNILLAIAIGWAIFGWYGKVELDFQHLLIQGFSQANSAAKVAGLETGDRIVSVNGYQIRSPMDLASSLSGNHGESVSIEITRNGKEMSLTISPSQEGKLGVQLKPVFKRRFENLTAFEALKKSVQDNMAMMKDVTAAFGQLFMKLFPPDSDPATTNGGDLELSGPVGIFQIGIEAFRSGGYSYWYFLMVISVNLGIINLLPLPVLDGGRILLYGIEAVKGGPVNSKIQQILFGLSAFFLIGLMLWVTAAELSGLL